MDVSHVCNAAIIDGPKLKLYVYIHVSDDLTWSRYGPKIHLGIVGEQFTDFKTEGGLNN